MVRFVRIAVVQNTPEPVGNCILHMGDFGGGSRPGRGPAPAANFFPGGDCDESANRVTRKSVFFAILVVSGATAVIWVNMLGTATPALAQKQPAPEPQLALPTETIDLVIPTRPSTWSSTSGERSWG